ncbi:MAG: hypothetical protein P4M12_00425 [Gammaproteobacteria bacterium]|nr:hypothetical protein [Gammaproteobacteria bacterium]
MFVFPSYTELLKGYFKRKRDAIKKYFDDKHYEALSAQKKNAEKIKDTQIGAYDMWNNTFPGAVIGTTMAIRAIVTQPLIPGLKPIIPPQKDAFWLVGEQIIPWIKDKLNWLYNCLPTYITNPCDKIMEGFRWLLNTKTVVTILNYLPFIGLGVSALLSIKEFYYEKNKNAANTLKLIANVSSAVLLGVGLGIMKWGSMVAALYVAPYLIITATALVVAVGLVKSFRHIYKALKDSENRTQHLVNAAKEFLCTFINAIGCALVVIGMQAGQKLQQFNISKFNFDVLVKAGEIYKKTFAVAYAGLIAVGALILINVVPVVWKGLKKLGNTIKGWLGFENKPATKSTKSVSPEVKQALKDDIDKQKDKLQKEMNQTGFIADRLKDQRKRKLNLLTKVKEVMDNPEDLVAVERKELLESSKAYQSFWKVKGKTQDLVERAIEISKAPQNAA